MRGMPVVAAIAAALVQAGCCLPSPVGMYREVRSDRHPPTAADVAGTWRVTPESAARAAATGLPLAEVQGGFITLREDGTCSGSIYPGVCGRFPTVRRKPTERCRWRVSPIDKPSIAVTFGEGRDTHGFEIHRLESTPPILWQYICDPDSAEYLEYRRSEP